MTIDLHTPQTEGFFRVPVDNLTAVAVLCDVLRQRLPANVVIVSPDAGRVKMAEQYAQRLHAPVAVLHKRRESDTEISVTHLVGDVRDRPCLLIDDMISTGGTVETSIRALLDAGARPEKTLAARHGLLLDSARDGLDQACVREVLVTETVRVAPDWPKLRIVSVRNCWAALSAGWLPIIHSAISSEQSCLRRCAPSVRNLANCRARESCAPTIITGWRGSRDFVAGEELPRSRVANGQGRSARSFALPMCGSPSRTP